MESQDFLPIVREAYTAAVVDAGVSELDVNESTALVGPDSALDSMALVTLILDLEQRLEEVAGISISLMSEEALSRRNSPFRTVGSLAEYVAETARADGGQSMSS
jgi:acyl carrier protein